MTGRGIGRAYVGSTRWEGADRSSPLRHDTVFAEEFFGQLRDTLFLERMEGKHGPAVSDVPLPSPDRARIRLRRALPKCVVVGPCRA